MMLSKKSVKCCKLSELCKVSSGLIFGNMLYPSAAKNYLYSGLYKKSFNELYTTHRTLVELVEQLIFQNRAYCLMW